MWNYCTCIYVFFYPYLYCLWFHQTQIKWHFVYRMIAVGIPWKRPLVSTQSSRGLSCAVSAFGWVLESDLLRRSCLGRGRVGLQPTVTKLLVARDQKTLWYPRVFGFWNVSWTCRSNFLGLFPQKARGHPILTKKITLLCKLLCCIMRDVISTNMLRFLWTSRQSVYFSKSVKCKSLVGRVRREKKSFNVSPQSLFPFSVSIQTFVWLFACTLMRKNTDCFTVYLLYY